MGQGKRRRFFSWEEVRMKSLQSIKWINYAMAVVTVGFLMVLGSRVEASSSPESVKTVKGEVSQVKGEFHMVRDRQGDDTLDIVDKSYVITDQSGKEVRLELSDDTEVQNRVTPGDKIEAKISAEGHTLSVTRLEQ
jgi:hypothetical protein